MDNDSFANFSVLIENIVFSYILSADMVIFFLTFLYLANASWWPPLHETNCAFNRQDSYDCLVKYIDVNPKDGQITLDEANAALTKYMPLWMRPIFWFTDASSVFKECDYDKNNVLTPRDWQMSEKTCLPIKESWCTVEWFCDRAKAQEGQK
jgi:hypothetical protein